MVRGGPGTAASGGDQSLGGLVGHLSRSGPAWRYSRDLWRYLPGRWGHSVSEVEDLAAEDAEHPLYDEFWASKAAPLELRLWAVAEAATDMDVFVAVQKVDREGQLVPFAFRAQYSDGPVALGWLRASHRELDSERSTEWQPVLRHTRAVPLTAGESTCLEIEIWPSGTRFEAGDTLRLVIQGRDIYDYPASLMADRHQESVNRGAHRLLSGGPFDSYLLVPVVSV